MSKYKEIKGFKVQTLASDTAATVAATGSWSSGGNLNTARGQVVGFGVTAAAGAAMGTSPSLVTSFEQYDGSSWTETTDINTAGRNGLGTGTLTAGLIYGGWPRAGKTESWNGSAWTEVGDMTRGANASQSQAGGGSQTAAFAAGGEPGTTYSQLAEIWNGSSWTEVAELSTLRQAAQGFGVTTAGYVASGYSPPVGSPYKTANVEVYDGSSWSETTNVNTAVGQGGGAGNATAGIIYGGNTGSSSAVAAAKTEFWDGSSWTELADMSTARYQLGKTVNPSTGSTDALAIGGEVPSYVASTEEWATASSFTKINLGQVYFNSGSNAFKVTSQAVSGGSWSSGGNLNTGRNYLPDFAFATQTAGFAVGGNISPKQQAEQYNGSSWTEVADLSSTLYGRAGFGTNASAVVAGGNGPPTSANSETWDNSSWTEGNNLNTARRDAAGAGVTTAGLVMAGGNHPTYPTVVESYNGTSYTESTDVNTGRAELGGGGTSTSALVFGGANGSNPVVAITESWDGSSWTEVGDLNAAKADGGTACVSNQGALYFGGSGPTASNEYWNGTSWTEVADLSTPRTGLGGNGTITSALAFGGYPITAATEEFTVPEANSTITVS